MARGTKNRNVIRFAVGEEDWAFVRPWRIWTHGSDTYIAVRQMGGLVKMSLHDSGVWVLAWTRESAVTPGETGGNRRMMRWDRPEEFRPGWTRGPVIAIPRVDDKHDLPVPIDSVFEGVTWLPTPAIGNMVTVSILFARNRMLHPNEFDRGTVVGSLPLRDGGMVWMMAVERPIMSGERAGIVQVRDQELGVGSVKGPTAIRRGLDCGSIIWHTTSPEGPPMLIQVAIGSHNYEAPLIET